MSDLFNLPGTLTTDAPNTGAPTTDATNVTAPTVTELDMLKQRARVMGLTFSNNIGTDALRAKIQAKLDGEEAASSSGSDNSDDADSSDSAADPGETAEKAAVAEFTASVLTAPPTPLPTPPAKPRTLRETLYEEQMKLVRVRITNLDPKKKDLPGEIFTVANEYLGTVRKYVPYGEVTDDGYHLPVCLFVALQERTFVSIKTRKGKNGVPIVETQDAREFAFEVLPLLTELELARLAAAQASRGQQD